jgi:hypothetical protein
MVFPEESSRFARTVLGFDLRMRLLDFLLEYILHVN